MRKLLGDFSAKSSLSSTVLYTFYKTVAYLSEVNIYYFQFLYSDWIYFNERIDNDMTNTYKLLCVCEVI
jgi:hypothetical protein